MDQFQTRFPHRALALCAAMTMGHVAASAKKPETQPDPLRGAVSTNWTEDWEYGMVSGNGRMGAVVYGKPESQTVILDQNHLYTSEFDPKNAKPAKTAQFLPEIRRIIREKGYAAALDFSYRKSKENGLAPDETIVYHPGFFIQCKIDGADKSTDYRRSENFETGEVVTNWQGSAGKFCTKVFVSRASNVAVMSILGPGKGRLNCHLGIDPIVNKLIRSQVRSGPNWIGVHNLYAEGNGDYDGAVRIQKEGGEISIKDGVVEAKNCDQITLLMRIERYRPPQSGTAEQVATGLQSVPAKYGPLLASHVKIHKPIFDRVRLDLGGGADRAKTTDELLDEAAKNHSLPPALMEKIYDACRYVILSSSGDLPPNLQGIWTGTWTPSWNSDYSADANLNLAVGSTVSANMPELMDGFFNLVEAGVPSWREGAKSLAGCRGILYPARMQDQGTYFQQTHDWPWFNQIPIAGWLGHYFYDYYQYTGDRAFLKRRAIPYLKECALFYEDWYTSDPSGYLRATPSFSYESAYGDNATIDFAVAKEVLTNLISGCETLGVESDGVIRWKALLAKIPPYMINDAQTTGGEEPPHVDMEGGNRAIADGTLKEFVQANMPEYFNHRHLSGLYPLFVSNELSPDKTPKLWKAAELYYAKKIAYDGRSDSHFRMNSSLCAARLGKGNDAWRFLTDMAANGVFHPSLVPSHYDHHSVFNVDASGGIPSVVDNCLVFSMPGQLDLLPALPSAIPQGAITGILARSGITVDRLSWDFQNGRVSLALRSKSRQKVDLGLPPGFQHPLVVLNGSRQSVVELGAGKNGCRVTLPQGKSVFEIRRG